MFLNLFPPKVVQEPTFSFNLDGSMNSLAIRIAAITFGLLLSLAPLRCDAAEDPDVQRAINRSLDYLVKEQRRQGSWEANGGTYRVAMTALAGTALLAEVQRLREESMPQTFPELSIS